MFTTKKIFDRGTPKSKFFKVNHWFVENKLNVHFGEYKAKSILFSPKHR